MIPIEVKCVICDKTITLPKHQIDLLKRVDGAITCSAECLVLWLAKKDEH